MKRLLPYRPKVLSRDELRYLAAYDIAWLWKDGPQISDEEFDRYVGRLFLSTGLRIEFDLDGEWRDVWQEEPAAAKPAVEKRGPGRLHVEDQYPEDIEAVVRIWEETPRLTDREAIDILLERVKGLSYKQAKLRVKRARELGLKPLP
jgi:hypothetical protein